MKMSSDLVGLLVHNYLNANGYDECAKKLAVILNLDVGSDLQGLCLQSVCQKYLKASSERDDPMGTLVYRYLKESGHDDLAKKLAKKLRLDLKVDLNDWSLQDICQQYPESSSKMAKMEYKDCNLNHSSTQNHTS